MGESVAGSGLPIRKLRNVRRVMGWEERRQERSPGCGAGVCDDIGMEVTLI